jgi:hypothetical protein
MHVFQPLLALFPILRQCYSPCLFCCFPSSFVPPPSAMFTAFDPLHCRLAKTDFGFHIMGWMFDAYSLLSFACDVFPPNKQAHPLISFMILR